MAVVGAGPVGLVAAIALARRGIAVTVLEAAPGLRAEGSKAICVQREPLETLVRLGAADGLLARGVSWTVGRTYYREAELLRLDLPVTGPEGLPPFINISQREVEEALLRRLLSLPCADLRWSHRAVGMTQDEAGVTLQVSTDEGLEDLRFRYVVAADGSRSTVRELLSVGFPGRTNRDAFLIADIQAELAFAHERRFFFDPPFNPGRQVLIHPQPDSVWRIDWQVPPEVEAEEERRTGRMDARIRAVIGDAPYNLRWLSTYRFHQRCADRFRVGRVFLAGDAAHLMAPFGARGMNSGIADAENLAWKLELVLAGHSPASLLESYEHERRSAAMKNLRVTGTTTRFLAPRSARERLRRTLVLRGARRLPPLRPLVDSGRLSTPHVYEPSAILERGPLVGRLPRTGAVAPDARCTVRGRPLVRRLREVLGDVVTGIYLAPDAVAATYVLQGQWQAPECPHRLCIVCSDPTIGEALSDNEIITIVDVDGAIAAACGGNKRLVVVRPDLHVAAVLRRPGPLDWATAAARATGALGRSSRTE